MKKSYRFSSFKWLLCVSLLLLCSVHFSYAQSGEDRLSLPSLERLAEVMGANQFLAKLCYDDKDLEWRQKAEVLSNTHKDDTLLRARLIHAFNRGYQSYQLTYRLCTENAEKAQNLLLQEANQLIISLESAFSG